MQKTTITDSIVYKISVVSQL